MFIILLIAIIPTIIMITPTIFIIMIIIPTIIMIIPTIFIITIMITIKAAPVINAKLAGVAERQEAKSGGICYHQLGWFFIPFGR